MNMICLKCGCRTQAPASPDPDGRLCCPDCLLERVQMVQMVAEVADAGDTVDLWQDLPIEGAGSGA
jgi:hypothetical protein